MPIAQQIPPAAFQSRKRRHGIFVMPATQAPKTRRPTTKRAKKTVLPPCFSKKRSPLGSAFSAWWATKPQRMRSRLPPTRARV